MTEPGRLRVAIFGESYLPYLSGVTVSTDGLARGLAAAGHKVLLVVPAPHPPPAHTPTADAPAIAWLPSFQGPPPVPIGYRVPLPRPSSTLRRARDFHPDVVHAQSPFISGLMARRIARATGAALVFTHHTRFGDYGHYLGPLAMPGRALLRAYLRSFWAGCAGIVAPSTDLAAEIRAIVAAFRRPPLVRTIATGLDLDAIRGLRPIDPRPLAGWPADALVVVSVGRLAREKSLELLVAAFEHAAAQDVRLRLLLVGDGPLRNLLAARANEPALAGRVFLAGSRPRVEALALAAGSDLFAFVSRTETQGLVLAEALAVGLPVVSLDGPGVRDSVRDGTDGVIVPRDPPSTGAERLGRAIGAIAADANQRHAMAGSARQGSDRFALERRINEVVGLYREAIARG